MRRDIGGYRDDYQEYKKLQDKLSYLENKINNIKTNIDNTYQREKREQISLSKKFLQPDSRRSQLQQS